MFRPAENRLPPAGIHPRSLRKFLQGGVGPWRCKKGDPSFRRAAFFLITSLNRITPAASISKTGSKIAFMLGSKSPFFIGGWKKFLRTS
jgi:hypothetical protein